MKQKNIDYEAKVTTDDSTKFYRGLCSTSFKLRYNVHKECFNNGQYSNRCELSKYIWDLKDHNGEYKVTWKILETVKGRLIGGQCKLCITEALHIITHPDRSNLLNQNAINKCPHDWKYKLKKYGF